MPSIAKTAIIYPGVVLGENAVIEDFCIIGIPCDAAKEQETIIGDNAIIRAGTYIYAGNIIGDHFQTGNKTNIRELNIIGNNVSVGTLSVIEHHVSIEDYVRIHTQVFVPEYTKLRKGSWIGPNVVLTNARFPKHPNVKDELYGADIGENAKIGANSTLWPSIVVGNNSLVGAGSVVTKNVKEGVIVAGSPALKKRNIDY